MGREKFAASQQCCWFCENATKPWKCPWVDRFKEIPGWKAEPTIIKNRVGRKVFIANSFNISFCPLFVSDNENAEPEHYPLEFNVSSLHGEILAQAVRDWRAIDYGKLRYTCTADGSIKRDELLEFFWGKWFETLVESCTQYTPQQIRDYINVPKRGEKI